MPTCLFLTQPYTHSQSIGNREHWGHSSNVMGVELAARADVKKLAIFHHDPNTTDEQISEFFSHTRKFLQGTRHAVRESIPGIPEHHPLTGDFQKKLFFPTMVSA